jgi:hypothetical protein
MFIHRLKNLLGRLYHVLDEFGLAAAKLRHQSWQKRNTSVRERAKPAEQFSTSNTRDLHHGFLIGLPNT